MTDLHALTAFHADALPTRNVMLPVSSGWWAGEQVIVEDVPQLAVRAGGYFRKFVEPESSYRIQSGRGRRLSLCCWNAAGQSQR
jgi:hypothetical protein